MRNLQFLLDFGGARLVLADLPASFADKGIDQLPARSGLIEMEFLDSLAAGFKRPMLDILEVGKRALHFAGLLSCLFQFVEKPLHLRILARQSCLDEFRLAAGDKICPANR